MVPWCSWYLILEKALGLGGLVPLGALVYQDLAADRALGPWCLGALSSPMWQGPWCPGGVTPLRQ